MAGRLGLCWDIILRLGEGSSDRAKIGQRLSHTVNLVDLAVSP